MSVSDAYSAESQCVVRESRGMMCMKSKCEVVEVADAFCVVRRGILRNALSAAGVYWLFSILRVQRSSYYTRISKWKS